jgi:hypothetical protein
MHEKKDQEQHKMRLRKLTNKFNTEIISTQHYIKVNEDEIELIYNFNDMTIQMHINAELVYHRKFQPNRVALNYLNVLEVAIMIYDNYKKSTQKE